MPVLLFDAGFLFSLAANQLYADVARDYWSGQHLWVPESVRDEIIYRRRNPHPKLPPELPGRAIGIITSSMWSFQVVEPTEAEKVEAIELRERIGGLGPTDNMGECEAAVLLSHRDPMAVVALDDRSCLPQLDRYVLDTTGHHMAYVHTSTIIDELHATGQINDNQRHAIATPCLPKDAPCFDRARLSRFMSAGGNSLVTFEWHLART